MEHCKREKSIVEKYRQSYKLKNQLITIGLFVIVLSLLGWAVSKIFLAIATTV